MSANCNGFERDLNPGAPRSRSAPATSRMSRRIRIHGKIRLFMGLLVAAAIGTVALLPYGATPGTQNGSCESTRRTNNASAVMPIERIKVGMRVWGAQTGDSHPSVVDPQTWRHLKIEASARWNEHTIDDIHIETLQPPEWATSHSACVGAEVSLPVDLTEMGLPETLRGLVVANEPCPSIASGSGQVVLTTINHLNDNVVELTLRNTHGVIEVIRPTGFHRIYREADSAWTAAQDLVPGDTLRSRTGPVTVIATRPAPGVHRVFNMTTEDTHVYHVSILGVLVHNNGCATTGDNAAILRRNLAREGRAPGPGQAAGHIVASTGNSRQFAAAARSREILSKYGIDINDAANGIPITHPRPHNVMHNTAFNEAVYGRLKGIVDNMTSKGWGKNAIRDALRRELRAIGKTVLAGGTP